MATSRILMTLAALLTIALVTGQFAGQGSGPPTLAMLVIFYLFMFSLAGSGKKSDKKSDK